MGRLARTLGQGLDEETVLLENFSFSISKLLVGDESQEFPFFSVWRAGKCMSGSVDRYRLNPRRAKKNRHHFFLPVKKGG
jgi:hypothetical protein